MTNERPERPAGRELAQAETGWESGSSAIAQVQDQVGAVAAVAREEGELRSAIIVAKRFPRSELDCYTKLLKSCERGTFAEEAVYNFPRAGQAVEGPSVAMAREAKRVWGNFRSGVRIVSKDDDWIHIKGWALDLETNAYEEEEAKFRRLVFRKKGGWQKPDERDERELTNRIGAIAERNCILRTLPPDLIEDAFEKVKETRVKAAKGELKQSKQEAIRRLVRAFAEIGVTAAMIETHLQHSLDVLDEQELVKLRGIWTSIRDGNSRRDEYFEMPKGAGGASGTAEVDLDDEVGVSTTPARRGGADPAKELPKEAPKDKVVADLPTQGVPPITEAEAAAIKAKEAAEGKQQKNGLF